MIASPPSANSPAAATAWSALAPALVSIVLCVQCLGLGYIWDDYAFLARVQTNPIDALGPQPGDFYRPISQALYFWPLVPLGSSGAVVAHLLNLGLLALSIGLLVSLTTRLAGGRAGLLAGLAFAALARTPTLVGWASGSQDLLAILFTLAAFHLRNSGRNVGAGVAFVAGLLSKETVAVMAPVLILWDWLTGKKPARVWSHALRYGGITLLWLVLHPGIHEIASRGLGSGPHRYVGFTNLALSEFFVRRYLLALFNVPDAMGGTPWPADRLTIGICAILIAVAGVWIASRRREGNDVSPRLSIPRAAGLAMLIAGPALAIPALLIQRWVSYYVCLPAVGVAFLAGVLLARIPPALAAVAIAATIGLGLECRATEVAGADALTERGLVEGSRAIRQVERGFREIHPRFPRRSQVLISVASSGHLGLHGTMHDGQALQIWYRDPSIRTLRPEQRGANPRAEYLFRVTEERDVVEINPDRVAARSSGGNPDLGETHAVIRTYARGLAATGEAGRSARILQRLATLDPDPLRSYDLRLAAMALFTRGDRDGAERLLTEASPISRDFALYGVAKVMAEPTERADLDSLAFPCFGVSGSDPEALRYLMQMFYASQFIPQAVHFARRLHDIAPADSESGAILRELAQPRPRRGE